MTCLRDLPELLRINGKGSSLWSERRAPYWGRVHWSLSNAKVMLANAAFGALWRRIASTSLCVTPCTLSCSVEGSSISTGIG